MIYIADYATLCYTTYGILPLRQPCLLRSSGANLGQAVEYLEAPSLPPSLPPPPPPSSPWVAFFTRLSGCDPCRVRRKSASIHALLVPSFRAKLEMTVGKRDSIHHHLLEVAFETATAPELRQKLEIIHNPLWVAVVVVVVMVVVVVYRIGLPDGNRSFER